MKFFNIDMHISVIEDLKYIFHDLGHEIDSWNMSMHNWVFGRKRHEVPMIMKNHLNIIQKEMWKPWQEKWGKMLDQYDGFVVTYPPIFAMLFQLTGKPVIMHIPIRYSTCVARDKEALGLFNDWIVGQVKKGLLHVTANNWYDAKYLEYHTGVLPEVIPSLCEYVKVKYQPRRRRDVWAAYARRINSWPARVKNPKQALGDRHKWTDWQKIRGFIHFPYQVSFMSLFEQYTANMPIMVPSPNYMMRLYEQNLVLQEMSIEKMNGRPPVPGPDDYRNLDNVRNWLRYADYYDNEYFPAILKFGGMDDLAEKAQSVNTDQVSERMRSDEAIRKEKVYAKWEKILGSM